MTLRKVKVVKGKCKACKNGWQLDPRRKVRVQCDVCGGEGVIYGYDWQDR